MTVQTTTLPAVNPIRLGSQPIRRRALVPQVELPVEVAEASDDDEAEGPGDEQNEQEDQTERPETDARTAANAAPPAAPVEPARRGRGRPRKNVVDVIAQGLIAQGSTKTPAPPVAAATWSNQEDLAALGAAAILASQEGLTLGSYVERARGMVEAYDRCATR